MQLDELVQCKLLHLLIWNTFQATCSDSEGEDGMVIDDGENGFPGQKLQNDFEFVDDQALLNLRDSDEETETESVMMVGAC